MMILAAIKNVSNFNKLLNNATFNYNQIAFMANQNFKIKTQKDLEERIRERKHSILERPPINSKKTSPKRRDQSDYSELRFKKILKDQQGFNKNIEKKILNEKDRVELVSEQQDTNNNDNQNTLLIDRKFLINNEKDFISKPSFKTIQNVKKYLDIYPNLIKKTTNPKELLILDDNIASKVAKQIYQSVNSNDNKVDYIKFMEYQPGIAKVN
jgi:hypothetical protein